MDFWTREMIERQTRLETERRSRERHYREVQGIPSAEALRRKHESKHRRFPPIDMTSGSKEEAHGSVAMDCAVGCGRRVYGKCSTCTYGY